MSLLKRLALGLAAGAALTLDQALRPAKVGEMRGAVSVVDEAEDGYEGVTRSRVSGAFQPAAETRADVWVHASATEGRAKDVVLAEEQAVRADVPSLTAICASTWAHREALHAAGNLYYEGDGDMSDAAREEKYGPGWRDLL